MSESIERAQDRHGLEILPAHECWSLLAITPVGRVAFQHDGETFILPVTHGVKGRRIFFCTGTGSKLAAAKMGEAVAFEADEWDAFSKSGWSVLVRGVMEPVFERDEIADYESSGVAAWLDSAREWGTWVRLRVDEISGRRLVG